MTREIFQPWSDEEIEEYQQTRKTELSPVYLKEEIPSDPESRLKYLTDYLLRKSGYDPKHDMINMLAIAKGKPKALIHLEEIALIECKQDNPNATF